MLEIFVTIALAWVVSNARNIDTLLGKRYKRPRPLLLWSWDY